MNLFKLLVHRASTLLCLVFLLATVSLAQHSQGSQGVPGRTSEKGVLLLAHGGNPNWNEEVNKVARELRKTWPTEVAFGMASKRAIQTAVDSLTASGVKEVIAVPLFISSHSSVITSTEFLLGLREEAPSALAIFAKMDHGGHGAADTHASHTAPDPSFDPMTPVISKAPIKMLSALNAHPIVADILLSRAEEISKRPNNEVVILVAHGPVSEETNRLWLNDMKDLADAMGGKSGFRRIEYLTVRDDAPEPIRSQATAELRAVVTKAANEKSTVLIVPLLLSYGGIEKGIQKRLEGLEYTMSGQALLPDERILKWIVGSVEQNTQTGK